MNKAAASKQVVVEREYGPVTAGNTVAGVAYDGEKLWFASEDGLTALDPTTGDYQPPIPMAADAGTAFDGTHLYQLAEERIDKVNPATGEVVATFPAPTGGSSGMTWAEGTLWIGQYRDCKILQVDAETGAVLRTIASDRFVTGVTWVDGELWHATSQDDVSDLRRVDPESGAVLEHLETPVTMISGLAADGDAFYCGGGHSRTIRKLRRA